MTEGQDASRWLRKITKDQNINQLDDIRLTPWDGLKQWFVSRIVGSNVEVARFNKHYGLAEYTGWIGNSSFTTTSAAALTLTCPANHRYEVYVAGAQNATQGSVVTLSGDIAGNALSNIVTGISSTTMNVVLGGCQNGATGVVINGPIILESADTLTLTLGTYAAGNDTEHYFLFRDYITGG